MTVVELLEKERVENILLDRDAAQKLENVFVSCSNHQDQFFLIFIEICFKEIKEDVF